MRSLPLIVPDGCTLSAEALAEQLGRAARLAPASVDVARSGVGVRVVFAPDVDDGLIEELIATEQTCCSFLELSYSGGVLQVESSDPRGPEVIDRLAAYFEEGR